MYFLLPEFVCLSKYKTIKFFMSLTIFYLLDTTIMTVFQICFTLLLLVIENEYVNMLQERPNKDTTYCDFNQLLSFAIIMRYHSSEHWGAGWLRWLSV